MKAIELQNYGDADDLQLVERPRPVAGPGQLLVRIAATSVNPLDPKRASGSLKAVFPLRFPFVPGGDFAGVVEAVGDGVHDRHVGDAVYGYTADGGTYAECIAVDAGRLAAKPANLDDAAAASLALVGQTAIQAIAAAGVAAGQTLLIVGAGGAVGSVAVSLAHALGATVIGVAAGRDHARLRTAGADRLIDRDTPFDEAVDGVDAVIDAAGGDAQARAFAVLRRGGVLVALSQPPSPDEAARLGVRAVMLDTHSSTADLDTLRARIEAGAVVPHIAAHFPLAQAAEAWRAVARGVDGKVVIDVPGAG